MRNNTVISTKKSGCYLLILETVGLVDVFTKPVYKQIIVHTLNHFIANKELIVYGWCLMTNKLYLLVQNKDTILQESIRKNFKQFTSEKIIEIIHSEPTEKQSWMLQHFSKNRRFLSGHKENSCWKEIKTAAYINMEDQEFLAEKLEFIHNIPVRERFVQYPADFYYSSAVDYTTGLPGLVNITKLNGVEQLLGNAESYQYKYNK